MKKFLWITGGVFVLLVVIGSLNHAAPIPTSVVQPTVEPSVQATETAVSVDSVQSVAVTPSPTPTPTPLPTATVVVITPTPKVIVVSPTPTATPTSALSSSYNTYVNIDGNTVQDPTYSDTVPSGATAHCKDGTYSFSQHHSGTCSGHGGVSLWL